MAVVQRTTMASSVRIAVLSLLVACGSKARAPVTHQVEIRAMQFVPAALTVAVGDTVVWTNRDVVPHTVTAVGSFDSLMIEGGRQWEHVVTRAGETGYVCTYHPTMQAKLIAR